ncbi:MAG: hypothetical protein KTR32_17320 [Granulosicoccus sp.]|nr:hypothetical protein [Granulosicoccus sp.]
MSANPSMIKSTAMNQPAVDVKLERSAISSTRSDVSIEYRITYSLVFLVCLFVTALCRLIPRNSHLEIGADDDRSRSLWGEARSAADSTVPYVFHQ